MTQELKKIGQTHPIKGFRPGHVPTAMLKKLFGKNVLVEVVNKDVYDALVGYIEDNKVAILGEPLIANSNEINFDADKDFKFVFELGLSPEINVTVDKSVNIPYYNITVDDEMVARQDAQFAERFGKQVPGDEVDAKALVKGSMQELNEDGSVKEDGVKVEKTIVSPEYFRTEDQKALFMGKKVGDHVVFNPSATCDGNIAEMASMLNVDKDKADVKSDFEMVIEEIIVLKNAEHGQELYDAVFGKDKVTDEAGFDAKIEERIAAEYQREADFRFMLDAKEYLLKKTDIKVPEEFMKRWLFTINEGKFTMEQIEKEFPLFLKDFRWQLIRQYIMKEQKMEIKREDLLAEAKKIASYQFAMYGLNDVPEEQLTSYAESLLANEQEGRRVYEKREEDMVLDYVKETVTLAEKSVTIEELQNMNN